MPRATAPSHGAEPGDEAAAGRGARDAASGGSAPAGARGAVDPDHVARGLLAFINASIMARSRPLGPDDDLQAAGVDSMAMLKILVHIEAEYGFWMPDADLREEHLRSVRTLARYVARVAAP